MDLKNIMSMIGGGSNLMGDLASQFGVDENSVKSLVSSGMPSIMNAMKENAGTESGAKSLLNAIEQHGNDDIAGMFKNISSVDKNDGLKILGHVFGGKFDDVASQLSGETGISESKVTDVMSNLAPMIMGVLGQKQKSMNLDVSQISNLLTGGADFFSSDALLSKAKDFIDKDNDGNIVDDIGGMLGGIFGKK